MQDLPKPASKTKTLTFVAIICCVSALILSVTASSLKEPQQKARALYQAKQLLTAAHILSYEETFLLDSQPAIYNVTKEKLIPYLGKKIPKAKTSEILKIVEKRVLMRLIDAKGNMRTFEEAGINEKKYMEDNEKYGFSKLPNKLVYVIEKNEPSSTPYGYVIPVNGYGLWDAIYGYLGLANDGDTVLGMTWYDQKETPGLGGNISTPTFQKQFYNKVIFQKNADGTTNFARAPLGITVVKTTAFEKYGDDPKGQSAVDGIPGATITANGVSLTLQRSLAEYRPFLLKVANNET
ncbi:MAG: NADH:ubiquinone reductase (Na(+)-transporting) subunit C [Simkaniaceae bacterium]|nr:NADH:ubiquinone reductase (Na(+)-transporting) subunit C [Simkaniaceae bacterium]